MRAAVIRALGRPPELADWSEPSGDTIYELSAVALNPIDVNIGAGRYFAGHPEFPYVPGCEGVGRSPDGTRVYLFGDGHGLSRDGLLAERALAPADLGIPLPDAVSDEIAASCGIAGMAGWMPLDVARAGAKGRSRARARCNRHRRPGRGAGSEASRCRTRRRGRP